MITRVREIGGIRLEIMDMSLESSESTDILIVEDFSIENPGDGDSCQDLSLEGVGINR